MTHDPFVGTRGNRSARYLICGEAYGKNEADQNLPLVGFSGQLLDQILVQAGIDPADCFYTNLINKRPPNNDFSHFLTGSTPFHGVKAGGPLLNALDTLSEQVRLVNPEIIIGLGNWPLWWFGRCAKIKAGIPSGITLWHGSQLLTPTGRKFVPIYHPALAARAWENTFYMARDLQLRVARDAPWTRPNNFLLSPSPAQIGHWFQNVSEVVCDIETRQGRIIVVGFAKSATDAIAIPFGLGVYDERTENTIRWFLHKKLNDPRLRIGNQNWRFDSQYLLRELLVRPRLDFDTMIMHHLLYPGTPKALHDLSNWYCNNHVFWKEEGKEWKVGDDLQTMLFYNCIDTSRTWEIKDNLSAIIQSQGLSGQLADRYEAWHFAARMMSVGIRVDPKVQSELINYCMNQILELEAQLQKYIPLDPDEKVPWYNSPTQTMRIFYSELNIPPELDRKTSRPTVGDEVFPMLKAKYPLLTPVLNTLQELRSLKTQLSNHLTAPLRAGRLVCEINTAGTETFRWATKKTAFGEGTNMQNIGKGKGKADV